MFLDDLHRPDPALVADCVHCGFCLPACPTYALWGEEMGSPRGRIHLMAQALDGAPLPGPVTVHIDSCLSCMGCLTACPSGVKYDQLVTATRAQIERHVRRRPGERAARAFIFGLFPYPRRLRAARAALLAAQASGLRRVLKHPPVAARLPPVVRAMESIAPPPTPYQRLGRRTPAVGARRGTVAILTGCVQSVFFSGVNAATARVLAAEGFDVEVPRGQGCCGALSGHAGREDEAVRYARATIDAFSASGADKVVVNAAGCGSAMKEFGHLLRDDAAYAGRAARFSAQVRDLAEFLVEVGPAPTATPSMPRSPITTPVIWPTPRAFAMLPGPCSTPFPAWSGVRSPRVSCAAARPVFTTCSSPARRASWATAKPPMCAPPGHRPWLPPTRAA